MRLSPVQRQEPVLYQLHCILMQFIYSVILKTITSFLYTLTLTHSPLDWEGSERFFPSLNSAGKSNRSLFISPVTSHFLIYADAAHQKGSKGPNQRRRCRAVTQQCVTRRAASGFSMHSPNSAGLMTASQAMGEKRISDKTSKQLQWCSRGMREKKEEEDYKCSCFCLAEFLPVGRGSGLWLTHYSHADLCLNRGTQNNPAAHVEICVTADQCENQSCPLMCTYEQVTVTVFTCTCHTPVKVNTLNEAITFAAATEIIPITWQQWW